VSRSRGKLESDLIRLMVVPEPRFFGTGTYYPSSQPIPDPPLTPDMAFIVARREAKARREVVKVYRGDRLLGTAYADGTFKQEP